MQGSNDHDPGVREPLGVYWYEPLKSNDAKAGNVMWVKHVIDYSTRTGGGMQIAPHANLNDGKLDLCVVGAMSVLKLFFLFPTIYLGRHLGLEEVEYTQAGRVRIETEYPIDVWADGEHVSKTPVSFAISPKALKVLTRAPVR